MTQTKHIKVTTVTRTIKWWRVIVRDVIVPPGGV